MTVAVALALLARTSALPILAGRIQVAAPAVVTLLPNYAATMLSPYEDKDVPPRLVPVRTTTPIRVGVALDAGFVTEDRLAIVRAACRAWETATRAQGVKGFRFAYVPIRRPGDADVVFQFERMLPGNPLRGITREREGWAFTQLAVEDALGKSLPRESVLRIATHELGHALGIWGHSPDPHDMMSTDQEARDVTLADVNTLRIAYGL